MPANAKYQYLIPLDVDTYMNCSAFELSLSLSLVAFHRLAPHKIGAPH
jgi:hypothetical protein